MRPARLVAGGFGVALVAFVLIWPFASGRWRGPIDQLGGETVVRPSEHDTGVTTTTLPPPSITVAAAGRFGSEMLQGLEFAFFEETGESVAVVGLSTEFEVWKLATQSNRVDADIIEVGFRSDALSGDASDAFLPLDETLIPGLASIPAEFRLPEDRGVVVGFSGLLGLVVNETKSSSPPRSWGDVAAVEPGRLIVPAPHSVMTPALVLALGGGDIERGLETYAGWVESGALTAVSVEDYVVALRQGAEVAVWTSSGLWRAEGRMEGLAFAAPAEGAVALPAFSGILSTSPNAEIAARWLDFRLSPSVQRDMASIAEHGRFGQDDLAALSPVIVGLDTLAPTSTAFFRLDTFPGSVVNIQWTAYTSAREAIDARFAEDPE